jgi:molybdate transport system substrate-binding protein
MRRIGVVSAMFLAACAAFGAPRPQLIVSAAASLTDVLSGLGPEAEAFTGAKILFNFAGSGTLRRQIEEGAPVDVFFSAAEQDMDRLAQEGLIASRTRRDLLSNSLVLIGDASSAPVRDIGELRAVLAEARFLAIGNPDTVPAGRYATQALRALSLEATVQGKLVLGGTVREVLQYVQSGSSPLGIVFATDARSAPPGSVRSLFHFPDAASSPPIRYPVAAIRASRNPSLALRLIEFLSGGAALEAFESAGFITLPR